MKTRVFTTGILLRKGRLLILKRKEDDDTYPGMWDCVGGHFEKGESAEQCMIREAKEESGLEVEIVKPGPLIEYTDEYGRAIAIPFLISSGSGKVVLTEHSEFKWVDPHDALRYDAVPDLILGLEAFGYLKAGSVLGRLANRA